MSKIKTWWLRLVLLLGVIIIMPAVVFTYRFYTMPFSNDIEDWGAFGNYFGGVLSPVIALIGTLILGYISYQISKQSVDENRNLFLFEQRILAFQRVSFLLNEIEGAIGKTTVFNFVFKDYKGEKALDHGDKAIESLLLSVSKIYIELKCFPINYSHLFNYDFESEKYKLLVKKSDKFFNSLDPSILNKELKNQFPEEDDFMEDLKTLIKELKKEIEIKK